MKLNAAGIDDKKLRRLVLSALRKAGYGPGRAQSSVKLHDQHGASGAGESVAGPSAVSQTSALEAVVRFYLTFLDLL